MEQNNKVTLSGINTHQFLHIWLQLVSLPLPDSESPPLLWS